MAAADDTRPRCSWVPAGDPLYTAYHDEEWGTPSHDDGHLYEMLVLEGAQAGLSWSTILRKREGYRRAFAGFDADREEGEKEEEALVHEGAGWAIVDSNHGPPPYQSGALNN